MLQIVGDLAFATVFADGQKLFDAGSHYIGIENHLAVQMPCRPAGGLDKAGLAAEKTFLVRVQNRHKRNLRQIQTLAQEVDAHEHIELAFAQGAENFHALNGINFAVQVTHIHADIA